MKKTKALIEGGADINYRTSSGYNAVTQALSMQDWESAYYLIVEKKAKVTEARYRNPLMIMPGDDPTDKFYPVELLRNKWFPKLDSDDYRIKLKIIEEFARQGVDYWSTPIPDYTLIKIKKLYPDSWEEYIKRY